MERKKAISNSESNEFSESLVDSLFKNSKDSVAFVTTDLVIRQLSSSLKKLTGYNPKDYIGKSVFKIPVFNLKYKAIILSHVKDCLATKKTQSYDVEFTKKNGTMGVANITSDVVVASGKIIGFIAFIREITKAKREKEKLEYDSKYFKDIYENAPIPFQSLDVNGNFLNVNLLWSSILGYKKSEIIGKNFSTLLDVCGKKNFKKKFALFKQKGFIDNVEHNLISKKGEKIIALFKGKWIKDDKGKLLRTECVFRDITAELLSQNKLKESEEKYRTLFSSMSSGFAFHEMLFTKSGKPKDYRFFEVNKSFEEITGLVANKIIGKTALQVLPQMEKKWIDIYGEVVKTRKVYQFESFTASLNKWFQVYAYYAGENNFVTLFNDITEQKKTEDKIKESQLRLQKAQEIAHVGSWEYDITTQQLTGSDEAKRIFELKLDSDNFTLENIERLITNKEQVHQALVDLITKNKPYNMTYTIILHKNKSKIEKTIHSIAELSISKDGSEKKVVGIVRDITDLYNIQENLKLEKEKTKELLDNSDEIIIYLDVNGKIRSLNKRGCKLLDIHQESVVGLDWINHFIPKENLQEIKTLFEKSILNKKDDSVYFENEIQSKKGTKYLIRWKNYLLRDKQKKVNGILSYGVDITKTVKIEQKQKQLLTAVEQASETIVITDLDGNIQYVNPYFEKTTGYSSKEAIGKNPRILKSGKQDKAYYANLWKTISEGNSWHGEFINKRKDGSEYIEDATISPIFNSNNKIIGYIALKIDITEQKNQEKELKEQMNELEEFQDVVVNRELRMAEIETENELLKKEIETLKSKINTSKKK